MKRLGLVGLALGGVALISAAMCARERRAPPRAASEPSTARFEDTLDVRAFWKGNLHTHSDRTDGDSPPEVVFAWYRDRGYAFLALTDHGVLTDPAEFPSVFRPGFVAIEGEEITMKVGETPVHVNALCTRRTIGTPPAFDSNGAALRWAVAQVKAQGAIALVNHPNFGDALVPEDLAAARGAAQLEIFSGHPYVKSAGSLVRPSSEQFWQIGLDAGEWFASVAVDDAHHFKPDARPPPASPGRAWVQVFAAEAPDGGAAPPDREAVCAELARGRLYSSSGVELARVRVEANSMSLWVAGEGAHVTFVGNGKRELAEMTPLRGEPAVYRLRGDETWVRARIERGDARAWTQAYRVARP